jgi:hypothetical protein
LISKSAAYEFERALVARSTGKKKTERLEDRVAYDRLRGARMRAKKCRVPCTLTIQEVDAIYSRSKGRCELTGIPFDTSETRGAWTPSLDRIDPEKGSVFENCRMICLAVNQAIGKWGEAVLGEIAKGYLSSKALL